jgi:type VI secretion system protein ImpB
MKVQDKLTGKDQQLGVELNFNHLDDFEPARVADQVPALRELVQMRQRLSELLGLTQNKEKVEQILLEVLSHSEKGQALAKELGIDATAPQTEESK